MIYVLAGFYLCYCWGIVAFYIVSWAVFGPSTKFVDRIAYALRWPLIPLQAPFVFLYVIFMNRGTFKQKAEAATKFWEAREQKPMDKTLKPRRGGKDYVQ